ncbi:MAG TPA: MerR family transcriptional regulator [Acidimicrobiales bacterium]
MFTSKVNADADDEDALTIDELAQAAGVVVSTVRLYQTRGLLPPPVKRGRVGYYGAGHLGRLRLVGELQQRGFSLAGIKALLDGMDRGESLQAVLGLEGEGRSTWVPEPPVTMTVAELAVHLPQVELDAGMVRRTIELGLLEFLPDGSGVVVRSASFLRIGSELAALGMPPGVILDEYEKLAGETQRIAARFTDVFRANLWEPFVRRGMPAAEIARLVGALEKLGPLAEAVVETSLRHALQQAAERFVEAEAIRLGVDIPRPGPR